MISVFKEVSALFAPGLISSFPLDLAALYIERFWPVKKPAPQAAGHLSDQN